VSLGSFVPLALADLLLFVFDEAAALSCETGDRVNNH
jgi:hypothetical protein